MKADLIDGIVTAMCDSKGQGMVEYVFLIAFIAMIVFAALGLLGTKVLDLFNSFITQFP